MWPIGNLSFNPWWGFKLLPQDLEHEAMETYMNWLECAMDQ